MSKIEFASSDIETDESRDDAQDQKTQHLTNGNDALSVPEIDNSANNPSVLKIDDPDKKQRRGVWKFPIALVICFVISLILAIFGGYFEASGRGQPDDVDEEWVALIFTVFFVISIILAWGTMAFHALNRSASRALSELGDQGRTDDVRFRQVVERRFGIATVESIFSYELYTRHEYRLDLERHHLAWVMLAGAALVTVSFSAYIVYNLLFPDQPMSVVNEASGSTSSRGLDLGETVITALIGLVPGIVTGAFYRMWTQTRENLRKTRSRSDMIQRQKIRLLLVAEDSAFSPDEEGLRKNIETKSLLIKYLGLPPEESKIENSEMPSVSDD